MEEGTQTLQLLELQSAAAAAGAAAAFRPHCSAPAVWAAARCAASGARRRPCCRACRPRRPARGAAATAGTCRVKGTDQPTNQPINQSMISLGRGRAQRSALEGLAGAGAGAGAGRAYLLAEGGRELHGGFDGAPQVGKPPGGLPALKAAGRGGVGGCGWGGWGGSDVGGWMWVDVGGWGGVARECEGSDDRTHQG